ncbi:DUF5828 family protein [Natrinema gelatinilyticum]|uniref:DUF5828 family protein n=1 Tax=Natrinema gelatinilyticum TaxID=2961571 RepID=UPI0020C28BF7|nr:DUF5828 family protein [Natrinema gelatinilyticum]
MEEHVSGFVVESDWADVVEHGNRITAAFRMVTKLSPFYFDDELVSATIQQHRLTDKYGYTFEMNINDDERTDAVRTLIVTVESEIDRWHHAAETETDTPKRPRESTSPTTDAAG